MKVCSLSSEYDDVFLILGGTCGDVRETDNMPFEDVSCLVDEGSSERQNKIQVNHIFLRVLR